MAEKLDLFKLIKLQSAMNIAITPKDEYYKIIQNIFIKERLKSRLDKATLENLTKFYAIYFIVCNLVYGDALIVQKGIIYYKPLIGMIDITFEEGRALIFVIENESRLKDVIKIMEWAKFHEAFILPLTGFINTDKIKDYEIRLLGRFLGLGKIKANLYIVKKRSLEGKIKKLLAP